MGLLVSCFDLGASKTFTYPFGVVVIIFLLLGALYTGDESNFF